MNYQTIAVIGGTGKSGQYLVNQLQNQGFKLRMLLREPSRFQGSHQGVEIVQGDARVYDAVHALLDGVDAVISTLGQPQGESSIFSDATKNVLRAMKIHGISRYVVTTGLHVDTPKDQKNPRVIYATQWMYDTFTEITEDKQLEYDILMESEADWTLVRLPMIRLTDERLITKASLIDCVGESISATDLACFLIEQLVDKQFVREAPFLSNS
tara:strand:- start:50 stop:685 length:636 start_codon:yes stop_codon:yes gene_type:complete